MWTVRHPRQLLVACLFALALVTEQLALNIVLFDQIIPQLRELQHCQGREK